jgi:diadenosine tetraphosphate (Ap4A) HIT family hydrolase
MNFQLHPRLAEDTFFIEDLPLSRVLLMNDQRFPWLILVPRRTSIKELYELELNDQHQLLLEINQISKQLQKQYFSDKLNIGMLGNIVPQFHVHIIARKSNDKTWPSPVWGFEKTIPYPAKQAKETIESLKLFTAGFAEVL